jgi:hypothetical protein
MTDCPSNHCHRHQIREVHEPLVVSPVPWEYPQSQPPGLQTRAPERACIEEQSFHGCFSFLSLFLPLTSHLLTFNSAFLLPWLLPSSDPFIPLSTCTRHSPSADCRCRRNIKETPACAARELGVELRAWSWKLCTSLWDSLDPAPGTPLHPLSLCLQDVVLQLQPQKHTWTFATCTLTTLPSKHQNLVITRTFPRAPF